MAHTKEAEAQTARWIQSASFQCQYIFEAYQILATAKPREWAHLFIHHLPVFRKATKHTPTTEQNRLLPNNNAWFESRFKQMVQEHFETCELPDIVDGLQYLNHYRDELFMTNLVGKLMGYMLCEKDSPFRFDAANERYECIVVNTVDAPNENVPSCPLPDDDSLDRVLPICDEWKQRTRSLKTPEEAPDTPSPFDFVDFPWWANSSANDEQFFADEMA